jgi:hypothetical protein
MRLDPANLTKRTSVEEVLREHDMQQASADFRTAGTRSGDAGQIRAAVEGDRRQA